MYLFKCFKHGLQCLEYSFHAEKLSVPFADCHTSEGEVSFPSAGSPHSQVTARFPNPASAPRLRAAQTGARSASAGRNQCVNGNDPR